MAANNIPREIINIRCQSGVAAVEMAFLLPVMLLIFAGIVEFGRVFWYYDALAKATRDGARVMSMYPKATIQSSGVGEAKAIVVAAANSAGINPSLSASQVSITCLNAAFASVTCSDGTSPENVKVVISGYTIDIGSSVPFFVGIGKTTKYNDIPLSPHTTMRYMF